MYGLYGQKHYKVERLKRWRTNRKTNRQTEFPPVGGVEWKAKLFAEKKPFHKFKWVEWSEMTHCALFWLLPGSIFTTWYLACRTLPWLWQFSLFYLFLSLVPLFPALQLAVCTTSSHHNLRCSFNQEIQIVAIVCHGGAIVFVFVQKTATANKASNAMSYGLLVQSLSNPN